MTETGKEELDGLAAEYVLGSLPADERRAAEARIAADPADLSARFDLALLHNGKGDREAAVDQLLEIFRRNRTWEDEKARKQLLQFFEAWGPTDPATLYGRRRLSSMLFS